jgi:hypothetical protein
MFLVFSNHFNIMMLKIIFKKQKNIINIYFNTKNYLKNIQNYTNKHHQKKVAMACSHVPVLAVNVDLKNK